MPPHQTNPLADWQAGYGPIVHRAETIERMQALVQRLVAQQRVADEATAHTLLAAADRCCRRPKTEPLFAGLPIEN